MFRDAAWLVRLMRPAHQLALVLIFFSVRYGIVAPWLDSFSFTDPLTNLHFAIVLLGALLLSCGAVLINDYFDWHDDRVSRPENVIVGRYLSRRSVILWHGILTSLGVLLLCYEAFYWQQYYLLLLFPFVARLLWYYSKLYKQRFWIGVPLFFVFLFSVPLLPLLFELLAINRTLWTLIALNDASVVSFLWLGLFYSLLLAFLGLLRAFEKQLIYYTERTHLRTETLPDRYGAQGAKMTVLSFKLLLLVLLFIFCVYVREKMHLAEVLYVSLLIGIPLLVSLVVGLLSNKPALRWARFATTLTALFVLLAPWLYRLSSTV